MEFHKIEKSKIKSVVRGHLLSLDKMPKTLKINGHELFTTRFYSIIITDKEVGFKKYDKVERFKFNQIKKFYLEDCKTFVFVREREQKRFKFPIE